MTKMRAFLTRTYVAFVIAYLAFTMSYLALVIGIASYSALH